MARQKGYTDSSLKREVDKQLRELDIEHLVGNLAMGVVADKIINIAGRTALSEIRDAAATAARAELDTHVTTVEDYVHSPEFVEETIAAINKFQLKG
jgi:UDP-N-acetylmuramate-alanine ligase